MTEKEKEMYAEKLQIEIFEHKNREETYLQRRKELLEIENAYRFVLSKNQEKLQGQGAGKERQVEVIENLEAQLDNFKEKGKQIGAAIKDLRNKADAMNDMVASKGDEVREIQIVND